MLRKIWLLSGLLYLCATVSVFAQDYVPPPMFGGTPQAAPSPDDKDDSAHTIAPAETPDAPDIKTRSVAPVIEKNQSAPVPIPRAKKVSKRVDLEPSATPSDKEQKQESPKQVTVSYSQGLSTPPLPAHKPEAPSSALSEEQVQEEPQAPKSQGVVTGPKTMPSVPAENYEAEETFAASDDAPREEKTILQRHEEQVQEDAVAEDFIQQPEQADETDTQTTLNVYTLADSGAKKITIPYVQGEAELSASVLNTIAKTALTILSDMGDQSRLQIMAYALPYDAGLSSDRRLSLTRALAIRDILLKAKIEPQRIDVRALGQNTDDEPKDRVDLIFYSDKSPL